MSVKTSILKELAKGPRTSRQLRDKTGVNRATLGKTLSMLVDQHRVTAQNGVFMLAKSDDIGIPAKLVKLGRSFGFAAALDASGDVFIPGHSLMGAMPGDEVMVRLFAHPRVPGSREGEIIEITKPNNRVVGTLAKQDGRLVLMPDASPDNAMPLARATGVEAGEGDKVAAEIVHRGERHSDHRVVVLLRFGSADSAKQNAKAILYAQGVQKAFPEEVKAEAKRVAAEPLRLDSKKRRDLRGWPIFTIDSASTKDIDDAVSASRTQDGGYMLGVHIADVSHYVKPGTALDKEALHRATSIYYADSVIPMLPKALSNGACSLNPQEDRYAFSCQMLLDASGRVVDYQFAKTLIRSRVKGVYSEINTLLAGEADEALRLKYAETAEAIEILHELYQKLATQRTARGSMELDSDEAKLVLNEEGVCVGIERRTRGVSERMIEEFMLLANGCAANLARRKELPFVYRVHEKPAPDRIDALKQLTKALGLSFKTAEPIPNQKEYAALLDATRGTPVAKPVHMGVLRSLAKAKYEPVPKGHFGLTLDDYAHFTSPIRRYPDLAIHRILSAYVAGQSPAELRGEYTEYAAEASSTSTEREIVAQSIERDCDDCYKAEYMRQFIGQEFDGVIGSVTSFGLYIELPNTVEGMIHVNALSDRRLELVDGIALVDPGTKKAYRLGEPLRIRVAGVDVSRGQIDFCLPD